VATLAQALPLLIVAAPLPPPFLAAGMLLSGLANQVVNAPSFTLVTLALSPPERAKAMLAFLRSSSAPPCCRPPAAPASRSPRVVGRHT
jgi:hypothetical protein